LITMSTIKTRAAAGCSVLILGLAGCTRPAPQPSPAAVAPAVRVNEDSVLADATLSGRVYELIGNAPRQVVGIEGATIYCEQCGASTHNWSSTDAKGEYIFPKGVWTEGCPSCPARIWVGKDGYQDPTGLPKTTPPNPSGAGWREVVISGDTRFEMELVRR